MFWQCPNKNVLIRIWILLNNWLDIQICNVKPLPDSGPPFDEPPLASVPFKVARFYQVNQVARFQLDRPVHKPPIDKENEFKVR